jgi:hypothetical protein
VHAVAREEAEEVLVEEAEEALVEDSGAAAEEALEAAAEADLEEEDAVEIVAAAGMPGVESGRAVGNTASLTVSA